MKSLLVFLAALLSLGACFAGGDPGPEIEYVGPTCRRVDCWCFILRDAQRRDGEAPARASGVDDPMASE